MRAIMPTLRHRLTFACALCGGLAVGCGKVEPTNAQTDQAGTAATQAAASAPGADMAKPPDAEARFRQSFVEATRAEPPDGWHRPPDQTLSGKPTGRLYTEVVRAWDTIPLVTAAGRQLEYRAVLETELGNIEIALRPDLAPNHVRNFVALARAGFFDELVFQRAVREQVEGQPDVELIEGGCPLGTGESGHGSIGYWLNHEITDEPQDEGTVGMCRSADDPDTGACRFYILLSKAPVLQGQYTVFGKVVSGLDVARKIHARPVLDSPQYPERDRPEKPVVIRKVTVQCRDGERVVSR